MEAGEAPGIIKKTERRKIGRCQKTNALNVREIRLGKALLGVPKTGMDGSAARSTPNSAEQIAQNETRTAASLMIRIPGYPALSQRVKINTGCSDLSMRPARS